MGAIFTVIGLAAAAKTAHMLGYTNSPRPSSGFFLPAQKESCAVPRFAFVPRTVPQLCGFNRPMRNKVPRPGLVFWCIKVLCTTIGETAADAATNKAGLGPIKVLGLFSSLLFFVAALQFTSIAYCPTLYWATVIFLSVVGTLITDYMHDFKQIENLTALWIWAIVLASVFAAWWLTERNLDVHYITSTRKEVFFWLTVLFTFAMGTAGGDAISETLMQPGGQKIGYRFALLLFTGAIALVVLLYYGSRLRCVPRRLRANTVACFWATYILTRPLGSSLGDFFAQDTHAGGLGLSAEWTSVLFICIIALMVAYLTWSRVDVIQFEGDRETPRADVADAPPAASASLSWVPAEENAAPVIFEAV